MITITNTITNITIAIITISPGPNVHTDAPQSIGSGQQIPLENVSRRSVLPRSNCLPFLQNLRLQLSTPLPRGIVRSRCGGRAKDKVQTTISTDVMISATIRHPLPATRHLPHASRCLAPATQQVSGSSTPEHTWEHIVKWDCECLASWECTWERRAK